MEGTSTARERRRLRGARYARAALVLSLVALALLPACRRGGRRVDSSATEPADASPASAAAASTVDQGFLYGRVTTVENVVFEGRLRWGRDEEASWGDTFNGYKKTNPWAAFVPAGHLPTVSRPLTLFGFELLRRERPLDLGRPFVTRFGDIARIDARGRDVVVTLKSGTVFVLDRFDASDFDDGLRVWDGRHGAVDLDSLRIRTVEFAAAPRQSAAPRRLYGTVRTPQGDFTGFLQWDRQLCVDTDDLRGFAAGAAASEVSVRFDTIRSIARTSDDGALLTLLDGGAIALSGTRAAGAENRGVYVDDPRYGRVLISWSAFVRLDLAPGGSGPSYGSFAAGMPFMGSVTTRSGRHLAGRLIYDLDESETTDSLDAPAQGVNYMIPFDKIASIVPPSRADATAEGGTVTLWNGEALRLERAGDLGRENAGILVFARGNDVPDYVPWTEVARVDLAPHAAESPVHPGAPSSGPSSSSKP